MRKLAARVDSSSRAACLANFATSGNKGATPGIRKVITACNQSAKLFPPPSAWDALQESMADRIFLPSKNDGSYDEASSPLQVHCRGGNLCPGESFQLSSSSFFPRWKVDFVVFLNSLSNLNFCLPSFQIKDNN